MLEAQCKLAQQQMDAASWERMKICVGHTDWVHCVASSPNNKVLASGSDDKTIIIWDVTEGFSQMQKLEGHTSTVKSVAFSPDSKVLASASTDETIRIWDVAEGFSLMKKLEGHRRGVVGRLLPGQQGARVRILRQDDQNMGHRQG